VIQTTQAAEIREFARRVERVCEFFLNRLSEDNLRNGSKDVRTLEDLKNEAADIQFERAQPVSETIDGLDDYMRGLNAPFEEAS